MQAEIQSSPRSYFLQPDLCRPSGMDWYGLKTDLLKSEGSMFGLALLRPPGASKKHMSRWAPRVRILFGNFEMPFCFGFWFPYIPNVQKKSIPGSNLIHLYIPMRHIPMATYTHETFTHRRHLPIAFIRSQFSLDNYP